jgi:GTP 3',8-cyclase
MSVLRDRHGRPLGALRISVTDRCNLRCRYCMPEAAYQWLAPEAILSLDELARVARVFVGLGVRKLRITGGEPLLRPGLASLVATLAAMPAVDDLALTTNGTRLAAEAAALAEAGLQRVTVSLDTLRPERMRAFARFDRVDDVVAGIDAARDVGMRGLKLNTVAVRGVNEDELAELVRFAWSRDLEPRFIEYMDVGGATTWRMDDVVPRDEIVARLAVELGPAEALARGDDPAAPAERWRFAGGTVGVVASTTVPFCGACDRARLTADGTFFTCLYASEGLDLRGPLREGASDADLGALVRQAWEARTDRGAEQRAALTVRGALVSPDMLRADPHREMHVRGG